MHAFLTHLHDAGFRGAPTVVGFDGEGQEIVTYIDGEVLGAGPTWRAGLPTPWPSWAQTEDCLVATAQLLRDFHSAATTFEPPPDAVWRRAYRPILGPGEVVCHGDVGPHNTVYREGLPVSLIDWDTIRPNDPLVELGEAAWRYIPLGDDAYFRRSDFSATPPLARRLGLFARAYGLHDRATVAWSLQQAKQRSAEDSRHFRLTPAQVAADLRRVATDLEWLDTTMPELVADLD